MSGMASAVREMARAVGELEATASNLSCMRSTLGAVPTHTTSFRLDATTVALMAELGERLGLPNAGVIRLAIRRLAQREGIPLPKAETPSKGGRPKK